MQFPPPCWNPCPLPQHFTLSQNFPNPFNNSTLIRFELPQSGEVELAIYNLAGQQVAKLVEGVREAGTYTIRWDGKDDSGKELASGVYLSPVAGVQVETRETGCGALRAKTVSEHWPSSNRR